LQADTKLKLESHNAAMNEAYLASASRMFLEGSVHATPMAAVIAGERSLREWCECLGFARFLYSEESATTEVTDEEEISSSLRW
jgi:hypothetical protein